MTESTGFAFLKQVEEPSNPISPSSSDIFRYFLWLGTVGFGGPLALITRMHEDLVTNRRWITQDEYNAGLALSKLCPGPLAGQLAIYLGWKRQKILGGTLAAFGILAPSFVMVVIFATLYLHWQGSPLLQGAFRGISAGVAAIIAIASWKLSVKSFDKNISVALLGILGVFVTIQYPDRLTLALVLAGMINLLRNRLKHSFDKIFFLALLIPVIAFSITKVAEPHSLKLFTYFFKVGALIFGSGMAMIPFIHQDTVIHFQWLSEQQFRDAVAIGTITPGPILITVAFIGFILKGLPGALTSTVGAFLPCYLCVLVIAPIYGRLITRSYVREFVDGLTACAIGAILASAWIIGKGSIVDMHSLIIACLSAVLLWSRKINEPSLVVLLGIYGALVFSGN